MFSSWSFLVWIRHPIHNSCEFLNAQPLLFLYGSGTRCPKIREQKIKTLTPREAGYTFKLTDKVLLDVRPSNERQKVHLSTNYHEKLFLVLVDRGCHILSLYIDHVAGLGERLYLDSCLWRRYIVWSEWPQQESIQLYDGYANHLLLKAVLPWLLLPLSCRRFLSFVCSFLFTV